MSRRGNLGLALLLLIFLTLACGSSAPTAKPSSEAGVNLLIVAEGEVLLKRDGWNDFHPTSFGVILNRGDQLQPASDAQAVVLCDNLSAWTVPAGVRSGLNNGCPQSSEPQLVRGESAIGNTRGSADPLIPYIISPRATKLLDSTPTLRWNPVPGAKNYNLRVSGTDWQTESSTDEYVYDGKPPLQPGVDYLWIVEADTGKSSQDEGLPGLGFSVLFDEEAERVRADSASIDELALSDEAKIFALAQLYSGHGLYAEAIQMLEELAEAGNQETNVYRALGELYQQVGLLAQAESSYSTALEFAESVGDVEGTVAAQSGLGEVYVALGNENEAVRWLTLAQAGYEILGDSQRASQIAEELAELDK
jgi:hypothetical protein